jgi:small subunit ribosomal protein S1
MSKNLTDSFRTAFCKKASYFFSFFGLCGQRRSRECRHFFKVGDNVKVKIIDIKDGKISLSVKALKENPWQSAVSKYHKGDKVEGVIIKFNKHGALASIEEGIAGLVHVSEFGSEEKLRQNLELGKRYPFTISLFEPKEMRMALTFSGDKK